MAKLRNIKPMVGKLPPLVRNSEPSMIKIGTPVSYDGGQGIVDRTSIKTGVKLYRVNDKWFAKGSLALVG